MKTAVLICGKCPKDYEFYYKSIYKTLIEPYNSDVFISSWSEPDIIEHLWKLYNPKYSKFENFSELKDTFKVHDNIPLSMFPMFYKLHNVNQLRLNYQERHSFEYDLVIRTRFDLNFSEKMECSTIQPFVYEHIPDEEIQDISNNLYLRLDPFYGNRVIDNFVWDQFAFGNNSNMNTYCNTYLNLENILLSGRENLNVNEMILSYHLRDNNIPLKHTHTTYKISKYV